MKEIKAFHYNLKEIYDFASESIFDVACDGIYPGLDLIEIIFSKNDFEKSMKDGYAPMFLPEFNEIENCAENNDQFILIIWNGEKIWTVVNGEDVSW